MFSNVSYVSGTTTASFYSQMLEQVPCHIRMTCDGRILDWNFPDYVRAEDRQIIAGLNAVQVRLAQPDASGDWKTEEQDANGTATVIYHTHGNGIIRKQRTAFTQLSAQGIGPDSSLRITHSEFTATAGPVWLKSFDGNESLEFIHEGKPSWSSRQHVKLEPRADQPVPEILLTLARSDTATEALAKLNGDLPEIVRMAGAGSITELETAAARKAQFANVGFEAMMQNFDATMSAARSQADRQPAIETLRDWLLARPEEAGKLAQYLTNRNLPQENSACIFNALEISSASPASQAVLATVLGDPNRETFGDAMLVQAVIAAAGVGEINDQNLMNHLFHLALTMDSTDTTQTSDSALFALGTLSRTNPAIRERLSSELGDTLTESTPETEGYVASALMGLANGGIRTDSLVASATQLFKDSPSDNIRGEALAYLHATGDASSAMTALADKSPLVQSRAVELLTAAGKMTDNSVAAVISTLRNPAIDESVRATAAQLLKRHESEHANIAPAYRDALAQNPPADLRELIKSLASSEAPR